MQSDINLFEGQGAIYLVISLIHVSLSNLWFLQFNNNIGVFVIKPDVSQMVAVSHPHIHSRNNPKTHIIRSTVSF